MADDNGQGRKLGRPVSELLRWMPPQLVREVLRRWRALNQLMASEWATVFYEVLDFRIEVDIQDRDGRLAVLRRWEEIRALQDRVVAYQDRIWGDGDVARNWRCSLGEPVDALDREGKRHLLVWLDAPLRQGQTKVVQVEQTTADTFCGQLEWYEVHIRHFTHKASGCFVFPRGRDPQQIRVLLFGPQGERSSQVKHTRRAAGRGRVEVMWRTWYPLAGSTVRTEWVW